MKNKILSFLLIIPVLILLLNYFFTSNIVTQIWYYLILYTGIVGLIFSLYLIVKKIDIKKMSNIDKLPFILLIIFIIFTIISTINSSNFLLSLLGTDYRKDGLYSYLGYIGIGLLAMFIFKEKEKMNIYKIFVLVGFILTIFTRFKYTHFLYPNQYQYNGIFFQFNHISYFLILSLICNTCLFILSNKKYSIVYLISYIFMLELLIKNNTFGSYLALLITTIMIVVYYITIKKIKFKPIVIIIIFTILSLAISNKDGVIVLQNFNININQVNEIKLNNINDEKELNKIKNLGTNRIGLWMKAVELISEHPILGIGIENAGDEYRKENLDNDKPHNLILGLMLFIGIPGALSLLLCFGIVVLKNIKNIKRINDTNFIALVGTICYLISSMFGNSMFYTQPYFSIFFGFLLGEIIKKYYITEN